MRTVEELIEIRTKNLSTLEEDYPREYPWVITKVEDALIRGSKKVQIADNNSAPAHSEDYWEKYSPLKKFISHVTIDKNYITWVVFYEKETIDYLIEKKGTLWDELSIEEKTKLWRERPKDYHELKEAYNKDK